MRTITQLTPVWRRLSSVLNGILQLRHAALVLRLLIDITVLPDHTDHDVWRLESAGD